jgi:hypothetical protein
VSSRRAPRVPEPPWRVPRVLKVVPGCLHNRAIPARVSSAFLVPVLTRVSSCLLRSLAARLLGARSSRPSATAMLRACLSRSPRRLLCHPPFLVALISCGYTLIHKCRLVRWQNVQPTLEFGGQLGAAHVAEHYGVFDCRSKRQLVFTSGGSRRCRSAGRSKRHWVFGQIQILATWKKVLVATGGESLPDTWVEAWSVEGNGQCWIQP